VQLSVRADKALIQAIVRFWLHAQANVGCPLLADFVVKVGDAKSAAIASMY